MNRQRVVIAVDRQVSLEARLDLPAQPRGAALILHPHPLYGGSMDNNVVYALTQAADLAGWASLRLNFRGVGQSTGRHDNGVGEQDDVIAAAAWLTEQAPGPLVVMGYSFGSLVGSQAAQRVAGLAGGVWVSPPFVLGDLPPWPAGRGPLLVITGDQDEYGDMTRLRGYMQEMGALGALEVHPGGDHFWLTGLSALKQQTVDFLTGLTG
ncbi:MAG: dienelactone hydrolase family protein [Desulfarculus sp.]|nr:dienelactone hydrolase family protein [Pseudomonadota bacterium]MBV1716197.1 dienelactone hydrolase family protein [Desulfarculus sp.]MBU4574222.1 dienelactone hydrolase family protein [Pseudomonadota bacterium]MBU4599779.1 dienelactone hydrolase family protein [Pseudomonadota bacterium]MBV1738148.1 dienelactone hydrolase family protein [Desulfarculus sp.]